MTAFLNLPCSQDQLLSFLACLQMYRTGRAPDSYVRGPGFDTRSGHILSFLLPLI